MSASTRAAGACGGPSSSGGRGSARTPPSRDQRVRRPACGAVAVPLVAGARRPPSAGRLAPRWPPPRGRRSARGRARLPSRASASTAAARARHARRGERRTLRSTSSRWRSAAAAPRPARVDPRTPERRSRRRQLSGVSLAARRRGHPRAGAFARRSCRRACRRRAPRTRACHPVTVNSYAKGLARAHRARCRAHGAPGQPALTVALSREESPLRAPRLSAASSTAAPGRRVRGCRSRSRRRPPRRSRGRRRSA